MDENPYQSPKSTGDVPPKVRPDYTISRRGLFIGGLFLMLAALAWQNDTLVSGNYGLALFMSLVFTVGADFLLCLLARQGGFWWRLAAIITMIPTLFIVSEIVRRAGS